VIVWVDGQLSPALAPWLTNEFGIEAFSIRHLNLLRAKDPVIFQAARKANASLLTKDSDFVLLQERLGPPPSILWVRCGNTSNQYLKRVLLRTFPSARRMIESGEALVELTDVP
jgi:predicted nuclease of predicted toxin-antitoxin system